MSRRLAYERRIRFTDELWQKIEAALPPKKSRSETIVDDIDKPAEDQNHKKHFFRQLNRTIAMLTSIALSGVFVTQQKLRCFIIKLWENLQ